MFRHAHEPSIWLTIFDPSVIAALVGAFAAFLLVAATDMRRHYRRRKLLRRRIITQRENVIELSRIFADNAASVEKDEYSTHSMIPFPVSEIRLLATEVSDKIGTVERLAIDNICFSFESIERLAQFIFDRTLTVIRYRNTKDDNIKKQMIDEIDLMKNEYKNINVIFKNLIWVLERYAAKEYSIYRDMATEDDESRGVDINQ